MKTFQYSIPLPLCVLLGSFAAADAPPAGATRDPELERQTFKVIDGFEVTLFASEPMLKKPINMNFDAQGRLWVASSETYPQLAPGDVPRDRVFVLEDTDGDGKADKSTVFAENLFIPTGIELGDGGAYVANSTELLHLKDTDGDGKADQRRVVLSGFGTEDTHHIIHGFRWDPHGRLNFWQSIYIGSRVETPHGTRVLLGGGVWHFRPETMELGVFVTGLINGWGIAWDRWGQAFGTDGAGSEGINYLLPGAAFTATPGAQRVLPGLNPNSPKYCANEVISGRHFPDDWQGDIITNDFRANRVVRFKIQDAGAGYKSEIQRPEVISSTDKAFRPVDVKMGPDGALYIADWYNPVINHGEVDFRSPTRDKLHGRIWRLSPKAGRPLQRPQLVGAKTEALLDLLLVPEQWTRQHAKLQLRERGAKDVVPALSKWVKALKLQSRGKDVEHARVEALWTYENVDHVEPTLLNELLKSPNPNARAAAVRVASHWVKHLDNPMDLLAPMVMDEHPRVRMEAVRAMAAVGTPEAVPAAMRAMDKPVDPFIDYALYKTANDLKDVWLPAFRAGRLGTWANAKHLNFALQAVKSADALKSLLAQLDGNQIPPESRKDVYEMIASIGTPEDLSMLLSRAALREDLDTASRTAAFRAVERGIRQRKLQVQEPYEDRYRPLLQAKDPELAAAAMRTAPLLGMNVRPELEKALSADTPTPVLLAAAQGLAESGPEGLKVLRARAGNTSPPNVRIASLAALASRDAKAAAAPAADLLRGFEARPTSPSLEPLLAAFLKKEGGTQALAAALRDKGVSRDVALLSLRYVQSTGQDAGALSEVLTKSAGITGGPRQLSADEMKQFVADVASRGDPARGEAVFRSASAQCFQCHALAGAGGTLAPDLRSIGAASPVEYIIESLLDPNKAIKDGYSSLIVTTKDGDLVHGIKVREDRSELVLRDNVREEIAVPVASIKSRKDGGSLMPPGLTDMLTRAELVDLVRFLTELGKPGPYALPNEPVVRRWRVMSSIPRELAEGEPKLPPISAGAAETAWLPAYTMASGVLPAEAVRPAAGGPVGFARCEIEATEAGKVRLALNSPKGLTLWAGERRVPLDGSEATLDLPRGVHVLTLRVDLAARGNEGIRLDVADAPGSTGHAQPVGGR